VLGVPDPVTGQEVALVAVPSADGCDPGALYERLRGELPRYALPSYIVLADSVPRTPTNKIRKVELRDTIDLAAAWRPAGIRFGQAPVAP
jgi:acyl-CoA synthetase (AMP-forming)/AMP-acid ligase II